ncbi:hypothetical protein CFC21_022766 [Triticum aestivum]|uniref:Uncharacterized protein n=2 Tax=Triticum aestivum TaxID=4565 RepID=A0A9R1ECY7_WHEAT|nr:omega-hydroxypalmitate O-feruloyl transferase-like [Triticum dicoccoides]XP_044323117.1 coniferyl alcohol acyltransferase-like [Triticum aestivum]KAF7007875.1 hypothetical protein CFC21_022766 [Triticum aestivum]
MSDSRVRVVSRSLVKAAGAVTPRILAVSNLDLLPRPIPSLLFCAYREPSTGCFRDVVAIFNARLPSLLEHFSPLAGRLMSSPRSGVPEVDCDNQGAELVVGEVGVGLASLDYGALGASLARIGALVQYGADVVLSVQLVSFACGGFTVAWCSNHVVMDGYGLCMLASMWSELARSGTIDTTRSSGAPNFDRAVLPRPRAAPSYSPSLSEAFTPFEDKHLVNSLTAGSYCVTRLYYIEERDIAMLRARASREAVGERRATRLEAVSAYLWKALAAVVAASGSDETCRMGWWVDGRRRLSVPGKEAAMRNYVGNVGTFALAEATVEEVQRRPLPDVASMVREAIAARATEEHFQELVDWVEEHKGGRFVETATVGLGSPALAVTSFASFRLRTDFGFGHAALAMPMMLAGTGRLCAGFVKIVPRPGGDGSWVVSMVVWPRLAAALDSDEQRILRPVTAEYLGLKAENPCSRL